MASRAEVVAEARSWIDTPWVHQQHQKGLACDCGGLVRGVMVQLSLASPDFREWPEALTYLGYPSQPDGILLRQACEKFLMPVARRDMKPGDVVLMITDYHPQHMGILGEYRHGGLSLIHASSTARPPRVIETRLMFGRNQRFVAAFSLPGVDTRWPS